MGIAWRSASAASPVRHAATALIAALALAASALPARADLQKLGGTLSIGGAKVWRVDKTGVGRDAPSGSMGFAAGVDYPVASHWRVGPEIGFDLLGTQNVDRGSFSATLDYSAFEASMLAHWLPDRLGPLRRVSFGPSMMGARAELSTSTGGASFLDLPVDEVAPGWAASLTVLPGGDSVVKAGLEAGLRWAYLRHESWRVAVARLAVHF